MLFKSTGTKTGRLVSVLLLVMFLAACATGAIREKMLSMPQIDGASYVGQDTCLECHDDMAGEDFATSTGGEGFAHTVHGRLADFEMMGAEKGCETCHGPGSLHVDAEGDPDSILRPAELSAEEVGAICATCHTDKTPDVDHGNPHPANDFTDTAGCMVCHTGANVVADVHGGTCATCHSGVPNRDNEMLGAAANGVDGDATQANGTAAGASWVSVECTTCHNVGTTTTTSDAHHVASTNNYAPAGNCSKILTGGLANSTSILKVPTAGTIVGLL